VPALHTETILGVSRSIAQLESALAAMDQRPSPMTIGSTPCLVFPIARATTGAVSTGLPSRLTEQEGRVLALVAEGRSNAEIAAFLSLSGSTVKFHLRNLFSKLGVANRTEAAAHYHKGRSQAL
jgi:DNA-binding CsgD family transcriptional regulator